MLGSRDEDSSLPATIGRYEVVRVLGQGAMGRVLLAHDPVLDRDVAVKFVRDDLKIPADAREGLVVRMRHEARAAARVSHPNLVTLHDMGQDPRVGLYLVFEYVEGPTLKQRLFEGPLEPHQAARLATELGAALTFAHQAGVLHRDIKPENVILSATGGKIADFGIARIPDSTLTHAGGLLGTPAYSAPETFRAGKFSPQSDQFSLAASLYEAVSGDRAFPGEDAVAVASLIRNDPPEPCAAARGFTGLVDEVLSRGMAKNAAARFPSCEAFGLALAGALRKSTRAERSAAASDATATLPLSQPPRPERKRSQVILGGVVIVVTAALLMRTALRSPEAATEAAPPRPVPAMSAGPPAPVKLRPPPPLRKERPRATPDPPADVPTPERDTPALAPTPTADAGADSPPAPTVSPPEPPPQPLPSPY